MGAKSDEGEMLTCRRMVVHMRSRSPIRFSLACLTRLGSGALVVFTFLDGPCSSAARAAVVLLFRTNVRSRVISMTSRSHWPHIKGKKRDTYQGFSRG